MPGLLLSYYNSSCLEYQNLKLPKLNCSIFLLSGNSQFHMKQIVSQASTTISNQISHLPQQLPIALRPLYHTIMATEVEQHRQEMIRLQSNLNTLRQSNTDIQDRLNILNQQYHEIIESRSQLSKTDSKYLDYVQNEVKLHTEIDGTKQHLERCKSDEKMTFDMLTQSMNNYHASDIQYREKIRYLSYIYGVSWIIIGGIFGYYVKTKFYKDLRNNYTIGNNTGNHTLPIAGALMTDRQNNEEENQLSLSLSLAMDKLTETINELKDNVKYMHSMHETEQEMLMQNQEKLLHLQENFGNFLQISQQENEDMYETTQHHESLIINNIEQDEQKQTSNDDDNVLGSMTDKLLPFGVGLGGALVIDVIVRSFLGNR